MAKSAAGSLNRPTYDRVTTHPGEVLSEEFLKPLGMSVNALALALRVPATRIGAIIKGDRAVTADTGWRAFLAPAPNSGSTCRRCMI
jgi:addiction module HigA family antidote